MNAFAEQAVSQEQGTPPSTNGENQTAAPSSHTDNGRDSHGRFAKGNSGGPGNPFARKAAALRAAFFNKITEHDIEELAQQLLDRAKSGDLAAMKVLFNYTIGRPTAPVDPDTLDVQEWQLHKESTTNSVDVGNVLSGVPLPGLRDRQLGPTGQGRRDGRLRFARTLRRSGRRAARAAEAGAAPREAWPASGCRRGAPQRERSPGRRVRFTSCDTSEVASSSNQDEKNCTESVTVRRAPS